MYILMGINIALISIIIIFIIPLFIGYFKLINRLAHIYSLTEIDDLSYVPRMKILLFFIIPTIIMDIIADEITKIQFKGDKKS